MKADPNETPLVVVDEALMTSLILFRFELGVVSLQNKSELLADHSNNLNTELTFSYFDCCLDSSSLL